LLSVAGTTAVPTAWSLPIDVAARPSIKAHASSAVTNVAGGPKHSIKARFRSCLDDVELIDFSGIADYPSASAILMRSATEPACILRIAWPR
jgi:hypothetical protein